MRAWCACRTGWQLHTHGAGLPCLGVRHAEEEERTGRAGLPWPLHLWRMPLSYFLITSFQ